MFRLNYQLNLNKSIRSFWLGWLLIVYDVIVEKCVGRPEAACSQFIAVSSKLFQYNQCS